MATETSSKYEVDAEELEFEIQRELHNAGKDEILAIALGLTIPKTELEGKTHLGTVKYVGKFIENMRGLAMGDEAKTVEHLEKIRDSINTIKASLRPETRPETTPKKEESSPCATARSSEVGDADSDDEEPPKSTRKKKEVTYPAPTTDASGKGCISSFAASIREFKINGSINKKDDKNCITFGGLSLQIKQAETKGVSEGEIILAVIRAMSPSLNLRRMLEVMGDSMTLPRLKSLLRAHYEEPRASDIHKELQELVQKSGEGTVEFVWRGYELAARLQIASEDEGEEGSLNFSSTQIKKILLESLDSGIKDETVRNELRKILAIPDVEIDEISIKLQSVLSLEKNRNEKLGKSEKTAKEKKVSVNGVKGQEQEKTLVETLKTLQCQVAAITKLQSEMETLKTQLKENNEKKPTNQGKGKRPLCQKCQTENLEKCIHCMNCGGEYHIAKNCFKPRNPKN